MATRTEGTAGHVTYRLDEYEVRSYAVPPWAEEKLPARPSPVFRALRGGIILRSLSGCVTRTNTDLISFA